MIERRGYAIRKRRGSGGAVVFAIWVLAAACNKSPSPRDAGFIRVDIETSPTVLDPRFTTDAAGSRVSELVFDSMVKIDRDGQFNGELAESFERIDDTTLVFHLRRDVRFSDGRELTSRDVKFTFDSIRDPESQSPKRNQIIEAGMIETPDAYTVVLRTQHPYAPALESAMIGVVPAGTPLPGNAGVPPSGAGPFKIVRFARDEAVVLERNPFRADARDAPPGVLFKVVPDPTVRVLELMEGICDLSENNIDAYVLPYLRRQSNLAVSESPGTTYQYLAFNFGNPHLRDLRVRRAIAFAIDRGAVVNSYLRGTAQVATGLLTPETWAYNGKVETYPYDPAEARRLLDSAGYREGPAGMRGLSFLYKTTPEGGRLAEVLQAMLRQVGIELRISSNEFATFYADLKRGNFDLASMRWIGVNDPNQYYRIFDSRMTPPGGDNRGSYSNPEMDRLVEAGRDTVKQAERREIYSRVQELAASDLPYVSLWWVKTVAVLNRDLSGFEPYPNGSLRTLATARFEGAATAGGRGR